MDIYKLPPQMITDLAMGVSDPMTIAANYGIDNVGYMKLAAQEQFRRMVADQKKIIDETGLTHKVKMAHLAEVLLHDTYQAALQSDSVQHKLEVAKYLSKLGGLEPQPGAAATAPGGGFSITFNFAGKAPVTIEGHTEEAVIPTDAAMWPEKLHKSPVASTTLNILQDDPLVAAPAHVTLLLPEPDNSALTQDASLAEDLP